MCASGERTEGPGLACGTSLHALLPEPTTKPIQSCAKGPHEQPPAGGSVVGTRLLTYLSPEATPTRRLQKVKAESLQKDTPKCERDSRWFLPGLKDALRSEAPSGLMFLKISEMGRTYHLPARDGVNITSGNLDSISVREACTLVGLEKAFLESSIHFHCL